MARSNDIGLVHFGYREYDPRVGRFITPDPIGLAGGDVDVYGYCLDDPINFVDRTGLNWEGRSAGFSTPGMTLDKMGGQGFNGRKVYGEFTENARIERFTDSSANDKRAKGDKPRSKEDQDEESSSKEDNEDKQDNAEESKSKSEDKKKGYTSKIRKLNPREQKELNKYMKEKLSSMGSFASYSALLSRESEDLSHMGM